MSKAGQVNAVRMDWLGVFCSFGCALHCAAMPILLSSLPTLTTVQWLADPLFHQIVAVVCSILVIRAIVPGFRIHRDQTVATLAAAGIALLLAAAFVLPDRCCNHSFANLSATQPVIASGLASQSIVLADSPYRLVSTTSPKVATSPTDTGSVETSPVVTMQNVSLQGSGPALEKLPLGRVLFSAETLERYLGSDIAEQLVHGQPFLSPLGGLLLIVAHVINIRLRCCRRTGCSS